MITWKEFAWSVLYFGVISGDIKGDSDYLTLMRQDQFLQCLRTNPKTIEVVDIREKIISDFLNRWKCRIINTRGVASTIRTSIHKLLGHLNALHDLRVESFQPDFVVNIEADQMTISEVIERCYGQIREIGYRFGPTATSKLLHILQPALFVMWDNPILDHYCKINSQVSDSGKGYCTYLLIMQDIAALISRVFQNPSDYLNTQLQYSPPKTMAKYLDEYNWITITYGVQVPPVWHP